MPHRDTHLAGLCSGSVLLGRGEISPERQPSGPDRAALPWKEALALISLIGPHRKRWLRDLVEREEEGQLDSGRQTVIWFFIKCSL
ncbi:hypothetical protein CgunFtcFv8_002105 [Champsocephalus gunnari]|uniref:Uncharacterized protein n=1 Tax=Champsocephalus gunnari TaxID=52237 RepID=A0AAN8CLX0_CHAGU|nr:hypothetical protein CgunFtcFv8_002105 [Champsocephalus gunnari]